MNTAEVCKVDWCNESVAHLGYCSRHYSQQHKYGKIAPQYKKPESMESVERRFWTKTTEDKETSCIEWQGALNDAGYGRFSYHGKTYRAHRVSYLLAYGSIDNSLHVCHHCDNPSCVNPKHLFLGTDSDNMKDKQKKGRCHKLSADKNPNTPFTWDDVNFIRAKYGNSDKQNYRQIGFEFNVSGATIKDILNYKSWRL